MVEPPSAATVSLSSSARAWSCPLRDGRGAGAEQAGEQVRTRAKRRA